MSDSGHLKAKFSSNLLASISIATLAFLFSSCSSVPEGSSAADEAALVDSPNEFAGRVESSFRKKIAFMEVSEIDAYLTKVANRLFAPGREPIQVEVVSTVNTTLDPSVWAIPNGKIFFDVRVLRALKFENEIAAAIAFAWDRTDGYEFRKRLIQEAGKADPNPEVIWKFTELEDQRAIEGSVERLYKSGYDPRGLPAYFDRVPGKPKNSGIDGLANSEKDKAQRTLSNYPPLLNPIVRTEDFIRMRKKLERL